MADYTSTVADFSLKSTWKIVYGGGQYYMSPTPSTASSTQTFSFTAIPAGSTIHSATLYADLGSPSTGAALRTVDGSSFNGSKAVSITAGGSNSFEFKFKANGTTTNPYGDRSSSLSFSNVRIVVDYTPPYTAPTMGNVTLDGSTAARYTAASAASAIAWTASAGSYNPITSYYTQVSVNGGGWIDATFYSGTNVTANPSPGGYYQYRVQAVGEYSSSDWAYSPILYSYSAVSMPTNLALSKGTVYTNEVLTLSWSGSSAGVGVNVSLYRIQQNSADKDTTTSTTYSLTAPATAGTYTYRVRAEGSVAGYDSGYTGTVTLTVIPRQSTYTLNKSTVDLGDTITATIAPVDPAFTHQVTFVFGASTLGPYTIAAGATTYVFTVPASTWGAQIPSTTSGTAACQMKTLNAGVQVGDIVTINFTITVPSTFLPTFSAGPTVVQTGNPTGFTTSSWFIQGVTRPQISATAIGSNGSAITKYNFSIANGGSGEVVGAGARSWTATTISTSGAAVWTVIATDSRGRTVTATGSIDVTAYSSPSVGINQLYRTTNGGLASTDGTYYKVRATATAITQGTPLAANAITEIKVQHRLKGTTAWSTPVAITNNTLSAVLGGGLIIILDSWEVRVSCRDKIKPSTDVYSWLGTLSPAVRAWDFRNDRGALGRFAVGAKTFLLPDDWTTNINAAKLTANAASDIAIGGSPLSVGGTNLLTNTDFENGWSEWGINSANTHLMDGSQYLSHVGKNLLVSGDAVDNYNGIYRQYTKFEVGKPYTLSGYYATANPNTWAVSCSADVTKTIVLPGSGLFAKFELTFTPTSPTGLIYILAKDLINSQEIYLDRLKLEKGHVATDWSPAPQDPMVGNPNILHNWEFINPINQRGCPINNYLPANNYGLDRWATSPSSYQYISGGLYAPTVGDHHLVQRIEGTRYGGKTYTASVAFGLNWGGFIAKVTMTLPVGSQVTAYFPGLTGVRVLLVDYGTHLEFRLITEQGGMSLSALKLELGTVGTLHLDPPMDHAVELPKCQRFFQVRSTNAVSAVDLRPSMRITPTVTGSGPYQYSADL